MPFDLELEALHASGVREDQIVFYREHIDSIIHSFSSRVNVSGDPFIISNKLFEWLWRIKPNRYKSKGPFTLNEVLECQINEMSQHVGNCLGLTVLFNCLLRRLGIQANALSLINAFETGPHVLTMLTVKNRHVDIEHILPAGFDFRGHLKDPSREQWGDRALVADIYFSMGNDFYENGDFDEALHHYNHAISLSPTYERAILNKAIVLDKIRIMRGHGNGS
jgi:hypothetical protein